jgi:hypothetical protein
LQLSAFFFLLLLELIFPAAAAVDECLFPLLEAVDVLGRFFFVGLFVAYS